ncbi:hypothetical protein EVAR_61615_1 [Eumeta japonica]|uniref:Uncharacterized protein n=1 Tax=Eumeta variegata TaxID=151549 RepID=A0A4C1ZKN8_EUMVA|nr:hypothetical protein EVAR_61615_1 [Eumeta japonica]
MTDDQNYDRDWDLMCARAGWNKADSSQSAVALTAVGNERFPSLRPGSLYRRTIAPMDGEFGVVVYQQTTNILNPHTVDRVPRSGGGAAAGVREPRYVTLPNERHHNINVAMIDGARSIVSTTPCPPPAPAPAARAQRPPPAAARARHPSSVVRRPKNRPE